MKYFINPIGTGGVIPKTPTSILYVIIPNLVSKTKKALPHCKINPGNKFSAFWHLYSFHLIIDKQTYHIVFLMGYRQFVTRRYWNALIYQFVIIRHFCGNILGTTLELEIYLPTYVDSTYAANSYASAGSSMNISENNSGMSVRVTNASAGSILICRANKGSCL